MEKTYEIMDLKYAGQETQEAYRTLEPESELVDIVQKDTASCDCVTTTCATLHRCPKHCPRD